MPEKPISFRVSEDLRDRIEEATEDGEHQSAAYRRLMRSGIDAADREVVTLPTSLLDRVDQEREEGEERADTVARLIRDSLEERDPLDLPPWAWVGWATTLLLAANDGFLSALQAGRLSAALAALSAFSIVGIVATLYLFRQARQQYTGTQHVSDAPGDG
jgi:Arc/MetJ-type ribon-helix-helix transcriptional regulator